MVIDASAVVAVLLAEPEAPRFETAMQSAAVRVISVVNAFEVFLKAARAPGGIERARLLLSALDITVVGVSPADLDGVVNAFQRFGKGRHPAGLNMGDCFAYALAQSRGEPLLFKGQDFAATDVVAG